MINDSRKTIRMALRCYDRNQVNPILKYERYPTAPSAKPFYFLLIVIFIGLAGLWFAVQFYHGDISAAVCRKG